MNWFNFWSRVISIFVGPNAVMRIHDPDYVPEDDVFVLYLKRDGQGAVHMYAKTHENEIKHIEELSSC